MLDAGLETLGGQGLGEPREVRAGRVPPGAQPVSLVVGRPVQGIGERGALGGLLDRRAQDVRGELIASLWQGDRELTVSPAV